MLWFWLEGCMEWGASKGLDWKGFLARGMYGMPKGLSARSASRRWMVMYVMPIMMSCYLSLIK